MVPVILSYAYSDRIAQDSHLIPYYLRTTALEFLYCFHYNNISGKVQEFEPDLYTHII